MREGDQGLFMVVSPIFFISSSSQCAGKRCGALFDNLRVGIGDLHALNVRGRLK